MSCRSFLVRYGEHVEITDGEGRLLASFKVRSNMCKEMFDLYLTGMHNVDTEKGYKIRRVG